MPLRCRSPFSPRTLCRGCFSVPSSDKDGLLAIALVAGADEISDRVQEELVLPSQGKGEKEN